LKKRQIREKKGGELLKQSGDAYEILPAGKRPRENSSHKRVAKARQKNPPQALTKGGGKERVIEKTRKTIKICARHLSIMAREWRLLCPVPGSGSSKGGRRDPREVKKHPIRLKFLRREGTKKSRNR